MRPRHIIKNRATSSTIEKFAERIGLVYFGYVDQRDDDHRLVRGHTVSSTHIDKNYCVGSIRGYDLSLITRNDLVVSPHMKQEQHCHWLIATVDLKTNIDIPHIYIGNISHAHAFSSSFEQIIPLSLSSLHEYPKSFTDHYAIYGKPTYAAYIGSLIVKEMAEVISAHFKQASIEIEDNCVYIYIESEHPSEVLLEKMVSNALWMAEAIDVRSHQLIHSDATENV